MVEYIVVCPHIQGTELITTLYSCRLLPSERSTNILLYLFAMLLWLTLFQLYHGDQFY
jgi:hypothetical protein